MPAGSVAWVQNDNNVSPTQTLNIYNCTITGNHTTGNTFHSDNIPLGIKS